MALSLWLSNCIKKALKIYAKRDELVKAQDTGDAARVIQVVKRVIYAG